MSDEGFLDKTLSLESDGNFRESEGSKEDKTEESDTRDSGTKMGKLIFDLNMPAEAVRIKRGFQDFAEFETRIPEKQTENHQLVHDIEVSEADERIGFGSKEMSLGGDLGRMERHPDVETSGSSSKKRRYSMEEKGKAKLGDELGIESFDHSNRGLGLDLEAMEVVSIQEEKEKQRVVDIEAPFGTELPLLDNLENKMENFVESTVLGSNHKKENAQMEESERIESLKFELRREEALLGAVEQAARRRTAISRRHYETARVNAQRFAHFNPKEEISQLELGKIENSKQEKKMPSREVDEESEDKFSPYSMAMETVKDRKARLNLQKKSLNGKSKPLFQWVPSNNESRNTLKRYIPSLLDLSLNVLAKNAEEIESLEHVPDVLKHKLSQVLSQSRHMSAHFVKLLAMGSPTEIRVKDCSWLKEEEFYKTFGGCDTKDLIVLQLDLCGPCMHDYVLRDTLTRSSHSLPALATVSLQGAYRLSNIGLKALTASAPTLQSINLSQCSLLTSSGINALANCFSSILRELYIDDCQNLDAMLILPALKKLRHLEVLSVAGIETVCDDFIIEIIAACGTNIRELVLANCLELTDISLKTVGKTCSRLSALDLSYLYKLTDSSIKYLADGCRSIQRFKLCRNDFSDEAIAAFLEASGESLRELSLNTLSKVGVNTALSLTKCTSNLLSLDLSWCRQLTDEALGLIVDSCLSLRLLKLFGCTQITDVFLNGHSNSLLRIIGLKTTPVLELLNVLETVESPLIYSPLTFPADYPKFDRQDD